MKYETPDPDDPIVGTEPLAWNDTEVADFSAGIRQLIGRRDFAALDALAASLRESNARFNKGGGWKIHTFYIVVTKPRYEDTTGWKAHIDLVQTWKKSMPDSITAMVALGRTHLAYAWFARGSGYAPNVSPIAWPIFQKHVGLALAEVQQAAKLRDRCHGYYDLLLNVGKAEGWAQNRFEEAFRQAIAFDNTYPYFYMAKAEYLLPRWHGKPGELKEFLDSFIPTLGEEQGLKLYYLVVSSIHDLSWETDFFGANGISWKQTKRGFLKHQEEHGASRLRVNGFAQMAHTARDAQAACNTFQRLLGPNDFEPDVWGTRENFEGNKNMALNVMCKIPKITNQAE